MTDHTSSSTTSSLPQILTAEDVPTLTSGFDASDVLECYLLQRRTFLHGLANSTIPITKLALGLRYRPPKVARGKLKPSFELTLEYGPLRAGDDLQHEAIPRIVMVDDEQSQQPPPPHDRKDKRKKKNKHNNNSTSSQEQQQQRYVSWENQAKVYFTLQISSAVYPTANYIASMTGAVLQNLLQTAVQYPSTGSHRRYQPFAVYMSSNSDSHNDNRDDNEKKQKEKLLLKSSSDVDFLQALWEQLAYVGVELEPLIAPQLVQIRLYATDIARVQAMTTSSSSKQQQQQQEQAQITTFYRNLYQCLAAIATADFSAYDDGDNEEENENNVGALPSSSLPTNSPAAEAPSSSSLMPTSAPQQHDKNNNTNHSATVAGNETKQDEPPRRQQRQRRQQQEEEQDNLDEPAREPQDEPQHDKKSAPPMSVNATTTTTAETTTTTTSLPTIAPRRPTTPDSEQAVEDATKAAQDAQDAAHEAQNSGNPQAAQAAKAAADAAQKAADSTASQAAAMAQKSLVGGNSAQAAEVISTFCLQNPTYGLAPSGTGADNASTASTTVVYLYWDGDFYYQVNLTAPYMQIVPLTSTLPRPNRLDMDFETEDYVDWMLAFLVLLFSLFGLVLLLQQVMGRNLMIVRPLFKFQRWFFDPHNQHHGNMMDDNSDERRLQGRGQEYTFAEDVIPLSMGGRMAVSQQQQQQQRFREQQQQQLHQSYQSSSPSAKSLQRWLSNNSSDLNQSHGMVEVELVTQTSRHSSSDFEEFFGGGGGETSPSSLAEDAFVEGSSITPTRLLRDPDLVDLPDLKSSSKVALPVGTASGHSRESSKNTTNIGDLDASE